MEKTRTCPYCGEEIMADAKKCRHCGEWLNDEAEPKQDPAQEMAIKEFENQLKNEVLVTTSHEEGSLIDSVPNKPNESLFKSCFWEQITKHYCDFKGNVDRKTFWVCYLYYSLIMLVIAGVSAIVPLLGIILMTVVSLGLLLPFLGLMVRRLHDIGKKGVWIFISLVPIVGAIWLLVLLAKKGLTQNPNKWNLKDTVITIAMVVVGIGLYILGLSGITSNLAEGNNRRDKWQEIGTDNSENEIKAELEQQVLEAYRAYTDYNNIAEINLGKSPSFQAASDAMSAAEEASGFVCLDWDYYTESQDPACRRVLDVRADIVDENKAHVYVTLQDYNAFENVWGPESRIIILVMTRKNSEGKWLVDDVGLGENSTKELMIDCVKGLLEEVANDIDYDDNGKVIEEESASDLGSASCGENRFVVIDGSELRLRLGPSTSSETLKWGDGSNRHPEVGEVFRLLDETEDFYKIDYKGNEVWVSKQFSHIEIQ